jgi:hypothetical protein
LCPSLSDALVAPHPNERHGANQIAYQHVSANRLAEIAVDVMIESTRKIQFRPT